MTGDMHALVAIVSKFELPSPNGLGFLMFSRLGGKERVNLLMNDEGVRRTAPATPGLLETL